MQFARAARGVASACLVSMLAACGGDGGGGDDYPANNTVVVNSATAATPAAVYQIDPASSEAATVTVSAGRVLEYAYTETSHFGVYVVFYRDDASKYFVIFDDGSDDFVCHSGNLSSLELTELADGPGTGVPACQGKLLIDAAAHRVKASRVTIPGYNTPANKVTLSANVGWSL